MKKIFFIVITIATLLTAKELPVEQSLVEGELENGFKYSIMKNLKPKDRAEFRLLVKVGSLEEDDDQRGVAHFVEHMAFNGSKHFKKNELIQYLESIGVKFGSHLNASTGYEKTFYMLTVPLEKDNLEKSFLVFEDWAGGLNFNEQEFNKERGVILEEARSRDTAGFRLYNRYKSMIFGDSKYMDRLPIGDLDIIRNIDVKRAKAFYDDWYRPEHMHFIAVGDFDVQKIEEYIKKHFSTLKNRSKRVLTSRDIADNNQTRVRFLTDKEVTSNSLTVQYIELLEDMRTKEDMRKGIIESMVFNLFNLKAEEQLIKENPKATTIRLTSGKVNIKKGGYAFRVGYRGEDEQSALKELYKLIWSFEKYGFSKEDLKLIKKEQLSSNEKAYKKIADRRSSSIASSLVHYALNNSILVNYDYNYELKKELIADISLDEVNALFRKVLQIKDRAIVFVNTTGEKLSKKTVLDAIESAKKGAEDFTKVKKISEKLLNRELKAKKICSKKFNKQTGVYEFVLKNGIKVAFKQTDFSKDSLTLQGFSSGGYSLYDVEHLDNAKKATEFVSKSGVGEFSIIDIAKILSGKQVSVTTHIYKLGEEIYGSANSQDIDSMFELLYLKLTQPKIDKIVANNRKKLLKYRVEQSDRNPKTKFSKELKLYFNKNHPRVFFDTTKSVESLNSAKMLEIYRDRFSDMNNFIFVLIGDVKLEKVELAIAKYLGNLPTREREEHFIDREIEHLKGKQEFVREYNNKNISQVGITFKSKIAYSKKRDFIRDAMNSILKVRLRELIREEKSGVYGVAVSSSISRLEKNHSSASIAFSCDPKRADELISEVLKAIEKLKKDGVTERELEVYREKFKVAYETSIRQNSYWISKMVASYRYKTTLESEIFELPALVKSISKEDVKIMTNSIFAEDRIISKLNPKK